MHEVTHDNTYCHYFAIAPQTVALRYYGGNLLLIPK